MDLQCVLKGKVTVYNVPGNLYTWDSTIPRFHDWAWSFGRSPGVANRMERGQPQAGLLSRFLLLFVDKVDLSCIGASK